MNLKSYTRGIGAGLIVAALVLGVGNKTEKMSDAQIRARALELGMIEAQTLTQISGDTQKVEEAPNENMTSASENETSINVNKDDVDEPAPEYKEPDEVTVDPIIDEEDLPENDNTEDAVQEDTDNSGDSENEQDDNSNNPDDEQGENDNEEGNVENQEGSVELQIVRGDSSVTVARHLFELGLVESAVEFDKYLCQNGYDRYISVGTYTINYGATFEEMAKIITGK